MAGFAAQRMIKGYMERRDYSVLSDSPLLVRRQFHDIDVEASFDPIKNELVVTA